MKTKKTATGSRKMQEYRARLRGQGLRPVQVWLPDTDAPGFRRRLRRQVGRLDPQEETNVLGFIEAVAEDRGR